jgi:hypothetical protein
VDGCKVTPWFVKTSAAQDLEFARNARSDSIFRSNWDIVESWSEQDRYRRQRPENAQALVEAVDDKRHGIIAWIKLHW